jgi:hypothetical protein
VAFRRPVGQAQSETKPRDHHPIRDACETESGRSFHESVRVKFQDESQRRLMVTVSILVGVHNALAGRGASGPRPSEVVDDFAAISRREGREIRR